jgi:hypothetical protein
MCHYLIKRCKLCHTTLSSRLVNCGKGLAILGPSGMTIECVEEIKEVIEESKICCKCVEKAKEAQVESAWDRFFAWRRGGMAE